MSWPDVICWVYGIHRDWHHLSRSHWWKVLCVCVSLYLPIPHWILAGGGAAEAHLSGRPPGSLWKVEGCPHTEAQHLPRAEVGCCWAADWRHLPWVQSSRDHCCLQTLPGSHLSIARPYKPVWSKAGAACRASLSPACSPLRQVMRTTENSWNMDLPSTYMVERFLFCFLLFA